MANAKKFKKIGGGFTNALEKLELEYDFANDGGAQGTVDLGEADADMVIHEAYTKVKAAVTSGGDPTLDIGSTGDPNAIMAAEVKANLGLNVISKGDSASVQLKVAKGDKILLTINTADLTAGKLRVVLMVSKF